MEQQSHFERVRDLVSGQSGVPASEITLETRLVEDLGMDGDDGHEFLEAFANEFDVDLSRMASLSYFDDEGVGLPVPSLVPLFSLVSPRFRGYVRHAARGRRVLTIRGLVALARARRWITPAQRPARGPDQLTWVGGLFIGVALLIPTWLSVGALVYLSTGGLAWSAVIWAALYFRLRRDLAWLRRHDLRGTGRRPHPHRSRLSAISRISS